MASAAEARDRRLFWGVGLVVLAADLVTKYLAELMLARHLPLPVIGDVVQLRLVYNQGAAFGIHLGAYSRWIFLTLAVVALVVLGSMVRTARPGDRLRIWALGLVCGGAAGNLVDRIRSADGVVDFLDVGLGPWRWPTFNVADSAITVGAVALAISLWLEGRAGEAAREAGAAEP
jgi:signal peptidase II